MVAEVISGPLSLLMMFGILRALMTHATKALRKRGFVNLEKGSTFGTPKCVQ